MLIALLTFYIICGELSIMLKDIDIEEMSLNDLEKIKDILISDFDDFWNFNILKKELESPNSKYIIVKTNDDEIIGFAGIKILVDNADIMNIVVKKSWRNQGVGNLLLNNLISICKDLNLLSLSLEVNEDNLPAIHLYEKVGFKQVGLRKNYYQDKNGIVMSYKIMT